VSILVTGGLGYIGSHVARVLARAGHEVVVVDDLSTGLASRGGGYPLARLDLSEPYSVPALVEFISEHSVDSVIHLAAKKRADESVDDPLQYYRQNVGSLRAVLEAMVASETARSIVFSSSAAVYGDVEGGVASETDAAAPVNPYGTTKLIGEWMVRDAVRAYGLRGASLRYFNVGGAGWPDLGDVVATNLVPMVFDRVEAGLPPRIFGDDFPTPDGTCVRDYVHVMDLAEAHAVVLDHLRAGGTDHTVLNVGTGVGTSVRQVIAEVARATGVALAPAVEDRRAGDPPSVVAAVDMIADRLGWRAQRGIREIVESAWTARGFGR
jgi:UDP-glucose 4-epimerase